MRLFFPNTPIGTSLTSNLITFCPAQIPPNLRAECLKHCTEGYKQGERDCLTVIAKIFESVPESKKWELYYIANMPCQLLKKYGFTPTTGMKPGRILFVANEKGLIRHVVLGLAPESNPHSKEETNEIFHCSQANNGGKIETLNELFAKRDAKKQRQMYCEIKSLPLLLSQRDPRTAEANVPAIIALGREMLTRYFPPASSSPRPNAPLLCARLVNYKPAEESKENEEHPSVVIPQNTLTSAFSNLTKCSPIYLFKTSLLFFLVRFILFFFVSC